MQVGHGGRGAGPVRLPVDLEEAGTVDDGLTRVEAGAGEARLLGGVQQVHPRLVVRRDVHDVDRAVRPVVRLGILVRLEALVQRVHGVRIPALGAVLVRPRVQILPRCPEGDAGVVRRAAAQDLRAGVPHEGVAALLRLDRVVPVIPGLQERGPRLQVQDSGVADVGGAGLQQADRDGGVLAQARGDRRSGAATADHDVVEGLECPHVDPLVSVRKRVSPRRTSR